MNLYHCIGELLYSHDCVVVPGLGGFVANYVPAKIHPILHTFSPPSKAILFNVRLQANDGVLASYISKKENISYDESMMRIRHFVDSITSTIDNSRTVEIIKVGTLYRDSESNLQFEPSKEVNYLLSSFGLTEFISPAIQRNALRLHQEKRLQDRPVTRNNRRMPVALKRSILIGLPVAALLVAGFLSINPLKQLYTQYSEIIPNLFNKKEITKNTDLANNNPAKVFMGLFDKNNSSDIVNKGSDHHSYRIANINTHASVAGTEINSDAMPVTDHKFYIVGGCFQIKENAEKFLQGIRAKGFESAGFFLPEKKKLYRVYFNGFDDRASAINEMNRIRKEVAPEAWLLEL